MNISDYFLSSTSEEGTLLQNEVRAQYVPDAKNGFGVWVGYDSLGKAVGYFETNRTDLHAVALSKVINIEPVTTKDTEKNKVFSAVKVTCLEKDLEKVFQHFMDDIVKTVETDQDFADHINNLAAEWRSLLQVAKRKLADSVAMGLFGELSFLEQAINEIGYEAVDFWQVTAKDIHDFISDQHRVEVKTSSFQNRNSVTIHGLKQLEPPKKAKLTLAVLEVQKHGRGDTLNAIATRISKKLISSESFINKLKDVDFLLGMPDGDEHSFEVVKWRFWDIDKNSPTLRSSSLPESVSDAISDVQYNLNLGSLGDSYAEFNWASFLINTKNS